MCYLPISFILFKWMNFDFFFLCEEIEIRKIAKCNCFSLSIKTNIIETGQICILAICVYMHEFNFLILNL